MDLNAMPQQESSYDRFRKAKDILYGSELGSKLDAFHALEHHTRDSTIDKLRRAKANLTEQINFGCGDFKDGLCNYERAHKSPYFGGHKGSGCCGRCATNIGYLGEIVFGAASYYAKRFNKKLGFWRPGKGCILARDMRSTTCTTYSCGRYMLEQDNKRLYQITSASTEE